MSIDARATAAATPATARRDIVVRELCAAADAGDGERFGSYFSDSAYFRFGNGDPIQGRGAIAASTDATVSAVLPIHHRIDQIVHAGDQLFCRFTIEATRPDGSVLAMPCVTVIEFAGELIVDYRVHMDISPALLTTA